MPNEELFSGIPSLGDAEGLEQYLNNSTLENMGVSGAIPSALQTQEPAAQEPATATPSTPTAPQYTSEQVAQIIARNQQLETAMAAQAQARAQAQAQYAAQQQQQQAYTPRQADLIKQLIDRGVPSERIAAALNGNRQAAAAQNAIAQRLANLEGYLQQQAYLSEQNEFIDRMTTFGDKFGLSEQDLVTFGNVAASKGINLTNITTVEDIETVFRAVYPEQYAIRSQRLAGAPAPHIYGGSSVPEAPRAAASRLEDQYVDQFLASAMPNQYTRK
jgi:hypothetical protein